jgi:3D (Asp-Asp-Asp) domain-containing protein
MAQVVNGSIVGVVSDTSGARLAGAQVVATNLSTGISWTADTTHSGEYSLLSVPAGEYRITVSSNGFKTSTIEKVDLQVQQTASINITLTVGAVAQSVTVESASALLQTQTSDVGSVITAKQIDAMPLNGRDALQLATLAPGVNTFYSDQSAPNRGAQFFQGPNFLGGSQNVGSDVTVGDSREISTQYRIDGINVTSPLVQ